MRLIAKKNRIKEWIIAQNIYGIIVSRLREGGREGLDTYIHIYILVGRS